MSIERKARADGTVVWIARPHIGGRRLGSRTFDRLGGAKAYVRKAESARPARHQGAVTVAEFVSRWLDEYRVAKRGPTRGKVKDEKTVRTYRYALNRLVAEHGRTRLEDFDRPLARQIAARFPVSHMVVIRNMFGDAHDDGLIAANPFSNLQLAHSDGRADNDVMDEAQLLRLADSAVGALHPETGPTWRTAILFAAYVGPRLESFCNVEWGDVDLNARTVRFRVVKFGRPYTAILLPRVADALRALPRRADHQRLFWSLRHRPLSKASHFTVWDKVRQHAGMPSLTFHELRHWAGHHWYVTLRFSADEAGAQLGHKDGRQIIATYGHGQAGALDRLRKGTERTAPITATKLPSAGEGST